MFTPQNKGWSLSPRVRGGADDGSGSTANPRGGLGGLASTKGKGKSVVEAAPPPQALLGDDGEDAFGGSTEVEAWRRFREAGLLDQSVLQRKDREALGQRITELEKELHEYQYNMGLLLIEKKESIARYEEVRQALAEAEEILKREQTAHLIAISEYEKREETWLKDLGVEKQKVSALEKDLREVRFEISEVKFSSERKLSEAHALETGLEEKYLEIEARMHAADAKLAEAGRRNSETNRKLEDIEARERKLQRDYLSLTSERKAHEKDLLEQREHLFDWEKRLQESQRRLVEEQRLLNEREDSANEADHILKKKETELEETREAIEASKRSLKLEEDDITIRLSSLTSKEKEAEIQMGSLERKERELFAREEKLNSRERVEIQKLLDDHNAMLDSKKHEFELEMENRRKSFEEEMKAKIDEVEEMKKELDHKEEQILEREHALEINMQKLKEMEKNLESKSQALKRWEESVQIYEKKLEEDKQQLVRDRADIVKSISELESLKVTIEAAKEQIIKEEEKLRLTKEEREEHNLQKSKLKQEIEDYMIMKDSLCRDSEDLRQQREKFEEEWQLLDEKQLALESETKQINDERERFGKWRNDEEERIRNEAKAKRISIATELEDLRMKKQAFEKTMEHERLDVHEMLTRERSAMAREFELRKDELEMDMRKRQEAMEKDLQDRESEFQRKMTIELDEIRSVSSDFELKSRNLEMEQDRLEREKEDLSAIRESLKTDQLEIQKDIDTLRVLSTELKDQRENFVEERDRFLGLANQFKICKNCGSSVCNLDLLGLQNTEVVRLPSLTFEDRLEAKDSETSPRHMVSPSVSSGGRLSWLRKCSGFFSFSPKGSEDTEQNQVKNPISLDVRLAREALDGEASDEPAPSQGIFAKSFDTQRTQSDSGIRDNEVSKRLGRAREELESSFGVADNSADIVGIQTDNAIKEVAVHLTHPINENERGGLSVPPRNESQPEPSNEKPRQPKRSGRPRKISRTRTVKAVVEEAQAILGETSMEKNGQPNGLAKHSLNIQESTEGNLVHAGQKRGLAHISVAAASELDGEDSETRSESISLGGRRKRRQINIPETQTPGEKRYNFRRSTIAAAARSISDQTKGHKRGGHQQPSGDESLRGDGDGEGTSKLRLDVEPASSFAAESLKSVDMQKMAAENVLDVQEIFQKPVSHEIEECHADDAGKSVEFSEQTGIEGVMADGATAVETEPATPDDGCSEDDDSDQDEENSDDQNRSIGKKLWTFFTT
ncbi:unnamed protein product [Musa acuminata subsp. burmannicoides]